MTTWTRNFQKYKIKFVVTFILGYFLMLTWCPHSQRLCDTCLRRNRLHWHNICIVNDYANNCKRSQRLRGRGCQCSQQPHRHCVSIVNYYAENGFSRISLQKQNISWIRFCLFIWGPGGFFYLKEVLKIASHCPFKVPKCQGWEFTPKFFL